MQRTLWALAAFGLACTPLHAQTQSATAANDAPAKASDEAVVTYPAAFFSRYRPNSALDMLNQLPGFRQASSGELRGYGSDTGNVLIDGRRPSSKRVTVPSILDRIPASQVDRIELIRGPVRDIELLGEPEVANVVLLADVPAAVRWIFTAYDNADMVRWPWFSNISVANSWRDIDYNAGLDMFRVAESDRNDERILDGNGDVTETRFEAGDEREFEANFDLSAATRIGETLITYSSQVGIQNGGEDFVSLRTPQSGDESESTEIFYGNSDEFQYEVGVTAERGLAADLTGNLLVFYSKEDENSIRTQRSLDASGEETAKRLKDTNQIEKEAILRTEFEWTGMPQHTVRFNMEGTYNLVDNTELETQDTGDGPVTVFVPGANTRIQEYRGDFLLKDIWTLGAFELDLGLGAEVSKLSQSGDADVDRNLSYLKPQSELSYTPNQSRRLRFRLAREVAQLVFEDFISASLFADEDLALGNPDLRPETTWISELGMEQRFGEKSVLKLAVFHHWISDVQDLIPITLTEEAPGNIGDGRRWGIKIEATAALDRLGLAGARLDINGRWQDSVVTDPVTGEERVLSATIITSSTGDIFATDNEYVFIVAFRQDLDAASVAWGWDATLEADLPVFKVNELDLRDKEAELNLFVETTRWLGLKVRLEFRNVLDRVIARERSIYSEERELSPLLRRQLQSRTAGREIGISLSGSF